MAQAQLLFTADTLSYMNDVGFKNVTWSPVRNEIVAELPDRFILKLKKKREVKLYLIKGNKTVKLPSLVFELFCHIKESV